MNMKFLNFFSGKFLLLRLLPMSMTPVMSFHSVEIIIIASIADII